MARCKITKRAVDAAAIPAANDTYLWDTEVRGFGLRVTPRGVRSYVLQYRLKNRPARRLTIGMHGSPWTAEKAREEAVRLLLMVRQGTDPMDLSRRVAQEALDLEFASYALRFRDLYLKTEWKDSWSLAFRRLEQHVTPRFKGRGLPSIGRQDVTALLDSLRDRPALALSVHAVLRKLFRWAVSRGDLTSSPIADMASPAPLRSRTRFLLDNELTAVWHGSHGLNEPFGAFIRLLICTLQRRNEVAGLRWEEISREGSLWSLPAERAKNEKRHLIPLCGLAIAELEKLGWQDSGFVLSTTGRSPISGFSKMKAALDKMVTADLQESSKGAGTVATLARWTLHDLRRTGTTTMQALGTPIEVTEKVINHTSGETAGIRGVYNLHAYTGEKRIALQAWNDHLARLLIPENATRANPTSRGVMWPS